MSAAELWDILATRRWLEKFASTGCKSLNQEVMIHAESSVLILRRMSSNFISSLRPIDSEETVSKDSNMRAKVSMTILLELGTQDGPPMVTKLIGTRILTSITKTELLLFTTESYSITLNSRRRLLRSTELNREVRLTQKSFAYRSDISWTKAYLYLTPSKQLSR